MSIIRSIDIHGKSYDVPVADLKWRPSAYGIVIQEDKVLLSPQFGDNRYDLPGGGVDLGELPEEGVIREVKEETGLEVESPKLINGVSRFFTFAHKTGPPEHVQSLMLYYACNLVGGELSTDGFDDYEKEYAKLAVWFPIGELDSIEVASSYDWRSLVKQVAAAG